MNLSPSDLLALRAEIRQAMAEVSSPYRDRNAAAAYLQCSVRSLDLDVAEGKLKPCGFYRGRPRFNTSDLDNLLTIKRAK